MLYQQLLLLFFVVTETPMLLPDAWPTSNNYKLINKLSREVISHQRKQPTAILHLCSNLTVDKAHATFYLIGKIQCGQYFFIWWINTIVFSGI